MPSLSEFRQEDQAPLGVPIGAATDGARRGGATGLLPPLQNLRRNPRSGERGELAERSGRYRGAAALHLERPLALELHNL